MLRILKYLKKKDWGIAVVAAAFIVAQVWLDLKMPDYMSEITLLVESEGSEMSAILTAGGKMLLCALGSLVSSIAVAVAAARIGTDFAGVLRREQFSRVQSYSMAEIGRFSTASLITRSTNDVMQVQMLIVMGLQSIVKAPVMAAWAIAKIAGKSREWTLSTAAAVILLLLLVIVCVALTLPKFRKLQRLTDDLNRVTRENLTGLRVVRAYNAEAYQEAKFNKANDELTRAHLFTSRTMAFMMPTIQMIMSGLSLAIYWLGAVMIENAGFQEKLGLFSEMVVFSQYAMQVVMAFMMLVMIFLILPRASVSARRILEVLDTAPSIQDGPGAEPEKERRGSVEFRNVSFRYPDAEGYVLHDISFAAEPGQTVAVIGSTGCGKSTLINLIPRFYDASEGEVLVDGVNVKDYAQRRLRDRIGFVSQRATLFTGTVRQNVAFGDNGRSAIPEEDVIESVYTAQAAEFVEKLPDGYDARIAQGGSNLSGGQKQRLSIARAVCRRPEILIFDDSFSALDYKTDRALRERLKADCGEATKIIVAQRIGTIRDADRILVLDQGELAGAGTHEELMKTCEVYREIAYSQLTEKELA